MRLGQKSMTRFITFTQLPVCWHTALSQSQNTNKKVRWQSENQCWPLKYKKKNSKEVILKIIFTRVNMLHTNPNPKMFFFFVSLFLLKNCVYSCVCILISFNLKLSYDRLVHAMEIIPVDISQIAIWPQSDQSRWNTMSGNTTQINSERYYPWATDTIEALLFGLTESPHVSSSVSLCLGHHVTDRQSVHAVTGFRGSPQWETRLVLASHTDQGDLLCVHYISTSDFPDVPKCTKTHSV